MLKLKGEALIDLGQLAEAALSLALEAAREHATLPILWPSHCVHGRLARRLGQPDDARREYDAARALVAALADTLNHGSLGKTFLSRAMGQLNDNDQLAAGQEQRLQ